MNQTKKILMILTFVLFMLISNSVGISPKTNVAKADDGETAEVLNGEGQKEEKEEPGQAAEEEKQQETAADPESEEPAVNEEASETEEKKEAVAENDAAPNAAALLAAKPEGEVTVRAADDGVVPYNPTAITISVTKVWDDNDSDLRPSSIMVKLYKYKGESYTDSDLYSRAAVTAENNWECSFEVIDTESDPAFYIGDDGSYHVYNFAVEEEPIPYYTEVEAAHKDPDVNMVVYTDSANWVWIRPNSVKTFEVYTETYPMSFIAAKDGHDLYIWTPEEVSEIEQKMLLQVVRTHPQFPHEDWEGTHYLTGFGHHEEGAFTMVSGNPGSITFDNKSDWSFWARGTYTRSTPEENSASITNKLETVDVTVTKSWDDADNQDGIRPDDLTLTLNVPDGVTAPDPEITKNGNSWTYKWSDLPKIDETYTVTEETVPTGYTCETKTVNAGGTITNKHTPETIELKIVKVWDDEDNKDGKRPGTLKVTLSNGDEVTLSENNQWTATVTVPKYNNGQEITYTWTEGDMPEGYELLSTKVAGLITTITNKYTPEPETIDITVKKVWNDANDKDKLRPAKVTVRILANGDEIESFELSEENKWTATLEDQPVSDGEKEITYTVNEDTVKSYTTAISGSAKDGFTVTNSHTPPSPPTPPKPPVPNTAGK
ncbi:MAG: Cna B-type domain-containing protein [Erysipelotrichaceae bacterium]|nr:Cna B-type domain-containing protein [Erysipelotrichaceae bacterium]MBR3168711.1 Cna B-type domain-containing protein [Erysipelotrichaceae bacterium]